VAVWRFFSNLKNVPAQSQTSLENIPKQQPNYRLSRTPASTVWSDWLTAQSGVARQPSYSPWQVDLCATVMWSITYCLKQTCLCTFVNSTVESLQRHGACHWRAFLIQTQFTGSPTHRRCRPYLFAFDLSSWRRCYVPKSHVCCL